MSKIAILTDSTADMNRELREKYNIDYFRMGFSSGDEEYVASLDWEDISYKDFYDSMRNGKGYLTSQVTVKHFLEKFSEYLKEGYDVLYIGCSSALSGSVAAAKLLLKELKNEYKDNKVICIDSLLSGMGQGMMAIKAAELRDEGKTVEEIAEFIEEMKMRCNQVGTVSTLEYLKKSGRVTASSAFFGNLFAVKPILISDDKGQNLAVKKVKGRMSSLEETVNQIEKFIKDPLNQTVYISHADAKEDADKVCEMLKERIPGIKTEQAIIGPIVGISVGPGTIIAYYQGVDKKEHMAQ